MIQALTKPNQQLEVIQDLVERKAVELMPVTAREIIVASRKGIKVNMATDQQLDTLVTSLILEGLLKLGHSKQKQDESDLLMFTRSIANLIREKWSYFTENEVRLVFKMGVRGDFKHKPEDVVFLNEPNINDWFKAYKYQRKSEAALQMRQIHDKLLSNSPIKPMTEQELFDLNLDNLENEMKRLEEGGYYRDFDLGNVILKMLEGIGIINLTNAEKTVILQQERNRLVLNKKPECRKDSTYKLFASAVGSEKYVSGNKFEEEAIANARHRALKGFILATLEAKGDIRTMVMEKVEANEKERRRLRSMSYEQLERQYAFYRDKHDRHAAALVQQEQQNRNLEKAAG